MEDRGIGIKTKTAVYMLMYVVIYLTILCMTLYTAICGADAFVAMGLVACSTVLICISALFMRFVNNEIVGPVHKIYNIVEDSYIDITEGRDGVEQRIRKMINETESSDGAINQFASMTAKLALELQKTKKELASKNREIEALKNDISGIAEHANVDELTRVRNANAYKYELEKINTKFKGDDIQNMQFAIAFVKIKNLKIINDTISRAAGNKTLKAVCTRICKAFAHSPVFRISGRTFAILIMGVDYSSMKTLFSEVKSETYNFEELSSTEKKESKGIKPDIEIFVSQFDTVSDKTIYDVEDRVKQKAYEQKL